MQETLKMANYAMNQLRYEICKNPRILVIMNMVPRIDELALHETLANLQNALLKMRVEQDGQNEAVGITIEKD